MTIPKITPYSGGIANPDGSQTQTEFTQNMFDQLSYEAELSTELNNTVDGINDTATQVDDDATSAAQSAASAEAAASGLNYQGLWPDTGGSADKGDTYQTQVSGTPTGKYFTALQNTTVDPVGDDFNWREIIGTDLGGVIGGTKLQHRRGTSAEIMAGTPETAELWFNTTDNTIHMGDGATVGGVKFNNSTINDDQTDTRRIIDELMVKGGNELLYRYQDGDNESLFIYIIHNKNWFQQWQLTRGISGFDNDVPTNPNGNMWMVNEISSVIAGPTESALGKDMTLTGSTQVFGDVVTITDGSAEVTLTGSDLVLTYVGRNSNGIADIFIDGDFYTQIDMYDPSTGGSVTKVTLASGLGDSPHLIKISTTGTKNPDAIDTKLRIQELELISAIDYDDLSTVSQITRPMENGSSTFKIGSAALELAVQSELNGNKVFSGAYHKYCYPTTVGSDKLFIDGVEVQLSSLVVGDYYSAKSVKLTQQLTLANGATPIADVSMGHSFSYKGLNLKSTLRWTAVVDVDRWYQSMWPLKGESVLFGGQKKKLQATGSGSSISLGVFNTYNAAVWNDTNDWVSYVTANAPANSQQKYGDHKGMYMWDRSTDSKVYMRGPANGLTAIGDSFITDSSFRIGLSPNSNQFLDYDILNP